MRAWSRWSRGEIGTALVIVALAGGFIVAAWLSSPGEGKARLADATVSSIAYPPDGRSRPVSAMIVLTLAGGAQAIVTRPMRCMPDVKAGDHVRLIGRKINAGGMRWAIVGEPCPT